MKYKIKKFLKSAKLYSLLQKQISTLGYIMSIVILKIKPIKADVMSIEETIKKIRDSKISVVRFGDGEIKLINNQQLSAYQSYNKNLSAYLKKILLLNKTNLLVCLPDTFKDLGRYKKKSRVYWSKHLIANRKIYSRYCQNRTFGNAFISRPYMIFNDKTNSSTWFSSLKKIWDKRDIIIIEGSLSRTGVGNDLFENVNSIGRIICPSANAFEKIETILTEALKIDNKKLILVALGPTAKPLVYELFQKGYQAIDIGHIDSEYEWFLTGVEEKTKINNKHTAEIPDTEELNDCINPEYYEQILVRVE